MSDLVAGRYARRHTLGSGGMGEVWLADDLELGRQVAIKRLRPSGVGGFDKGLVERMTREARVAARLRHPHIVTIFDILHDGDEPVLVMDYVEGESLAQRLARQRCLDLPDVARIGSEVAAALAAAHRAGIVHRDVKPGNILLDQDGHAHLADFGIARGPQDMALTTTGQMLGTVWYMAPEIARTGSAGPPSDVWSLGATLFAALDGHAPFADAHNTPGLDTNPAAIIYRVATQPSPMPVNAGELAPIVNAMLGMDPESRPSAAEAAQLLGAVAAGHAAQRAAAASPTVLLPAAAPPPAVTPPPAVAPHFALTPLPPPAHGFVPHPPPRSSRRRALLWAVPAAVIVAAAGTGAFLVAASDDDGPALAGGSGSVTTSAPREPVTSAPVTSTTSSPVAVTPPRAGRRVVRLAARLLRRPRRDRPALRRPRLHRRLLRPRAQDIPMAAGPSRTPDGSDDAAGRVARRRLPPAGARVGDGGGLLPRGCVEAGGGAVHAPVGTGPGITEPNTRPGTAPYTPPTTQPPTTQPPTTRPPTTQPPVTDPPPIDPPPLK